MRSELKFTTLLLQCRKNVLSFMIHWEMERNEVRFCVNPFFPPFMSVDKGHSKELNKSLLCYSPCFGPFSLFFGIHHHVFFIALIFEFDTMITLILIPAWCSVGKGDLEVGCRDYRDLNGYPK